MNHLFALILIFVSPVLPQSWWALSHLSSANLRNDQFDCNAFPGLSKRQRDICRSNSEAMKAVVVGMQNAVHECRRQFADERWNCTGENGFGETPFKVASKESAYVYAITAAGVSHSLARSCSKGLIADCGCGDLPKNEYSFTRQIRSNSGEPPEFVWSGCSDNVKYGNTFGRRFIDSVEKQSSDAKALMNLHNNRVGRKLLSQSMQKKCKCHGVSGSCVTKTCWYAVPKFDNFAKDLKEKYLTARQVTVKPQSSDLMIRVDEEPIVTGSRAGRYLDNLQNDISVFPRFRRAARNDLVFLEASPDYCYENETMDIHGPRGRECGDSTQCQNLCCGRGWVTILERKQEPCNCKFIWCCEVKCDTCNTTVERHFCR